MSYLKAFNWVPRVNDFCFCHPLPVGTQIIGWVSLILSLIGVSAEGASVHEIDDDKLFGASIVGGILVLIAAIFLLIGVYTKNEILIQIYMILTFCTVIWLIVDLLFILLYFLEGHMLFRTFLALLIKSAITLLLITYFLVVVFSFYRQEYRI